jgi:hypothetical protein
VPIQNGLEFTKYLTNETDPTVWFSAFSNLLKVRMLWGPDTVEDSFKALRAYLLPRVESVREKVDQLLKKNPEEVSAVSILHNQVVDWTCALNSTWCGEQARRLFDEWSRSPASNPVPNNLQSTLYCKMVEVVGGPAYNFILEQYQKPGQTRNQKARLAPSLGCRSDGNYDAMTLGFERKEIDSVDSIPLLQRVLIQTDLGRTQTLVYLQLAKELIRDFGWTVQELVQVVSVGQNYFGRTQDSDGTKLILVENADIFGNSLNATINAIDANIEWDREFGSNITTWFNANSN